MADVNDMFDDITKEQSIVNPNAKKKQWTPLATGEYYGHIVDVQTKILDVKGGKYKARLYSYTVEASEEKMIKQMEGFGMDVIPVPFRDAYAFGGSLHCATTDVYRKGECEDYFPNQKN